MSSVVTILKTSFSGSLAIFFCLDTMYWVSCAWPSLFISTSSSFIKKQMSDIAAMLTCSGYFLGRLRPYLTGAREVEGAEGDWAIGFIEDISAGGAPVWGISAGTVFTRYAFAWDTYVGTKLFNTDFWSLRKYNFIKLLLNLMRQCDNSIITDLLWILNSL